MAEFTRVVDLVDTVEAFQLNQYAAALEGDVGAGKAITLTALSDSVAYALRVANQDTVNGRALKVFKANLTDAWIDVTKTGMRLDGVQLVHQGSSPDAPGAGLTAVYPKTDDLLYFRSGSGSERQIVTSTILTATGDLLYASAANTVARLAIGGTGALLHNSGSGAPSWLGIGSAGQVLTVTGGVPVWAAASSTIGIIDAAGDLIYGTADDTPARLAIGTARQVLAVNAGATAPEWVASLQSLMTAQGDTVYASAANTPARLAKGTAYQGLMMNAGATAPEWAATAKETLSGTGDLLYSSAGNVLARRAIGTRGYVLMAGASVPQYDIIGRKNRLINGDMRVLQRRAFDSAVTAADNTYQGNDRWKTLDGTSSGTSPNVQPSNSISTGNGASKTVFAFQSIGGTGKFGVIQIIEGKDMYDLRGQTVSLQVKIAAGASFGDVRIGILQWVGTEDDVTADPISAWNTAATLPTLIANWSFANTPANLSVTTSLVTYKVEGIAVSGSATNLAIMIWNDDTATTLGEFFYFTDVQLERGSLCTDVERPAFTEELARCQRFYAKTFTLATAPAQNVGSVLGALSYRVAVTGATSGAAYWQFPVRMRTAPTVTTYNPSAANANWRNTTDGADSGTATANNPSERGVEIQNGQAAGDAAGELVTIHAAAAAEL
jgi:hypothetical protein